MAGAPTTRTIHIGLLNYPGVMQSALHGLTEMFYFTNRICAEHSQANLPQFSISHWQIQNEGITQSINPLQAMSSRLPVLQVLIVPPSVNNHYYPQPAPLLLDWINQHHASGTIICSACAGTFILAAAGLLTNRNATTHWQLTADFQQRFPQVRLDTDRILINDGDIITAGGLMSWMDLGLELVEQFTRPAILQKLGKWLIIDIGKREQRFYKQFIPPLDHGNSLIIKAQHYIQKKYANPLSVKFLAEYCCVGERTLLRNFVSTTGYTPMEYIQQVRIQKSRELLETTTRRIEQIALQVGYEDSGAFRKLFKKFTGLSPKEFRLRFVA